MHSQNSRVQAGYNPAVLLKQAAFTFKFEKLAGAGIGWQIAARKLGSRKRELLIDVNIHKLFARIPIPFPGYVNGNNSIFFPVQIFHHLKSGNNRNVMLGGFPAKKYRDIKHSSLLPFKRNYQANRFQKAQYLPEGLSLPASRQPP